MQRHRALFYFYFNKINRACDLKLSILCFVLFGLLIILASSFNLFSEVFSYAYIVATWR